MTTHDTPQRTMRERMSDAEIAAVRERAAATVDLWECSNMVDHDIPRLCDELEAARSVIAWYANPDNWQNFEGTGYLIAYDNDAYQPDNGSRAHAYLRATDAARSTEE